MSLALTIAGMALVTFGLRVSFLLLPGHVQLPALVRRALRYVPAAVLTAIWVPGILLPGGQLDPTPSNAHLLAGLVAIAAAWRFRATLVTILAGMAALHLFS